MLELRTEPNLAEDNDSLRPSLWIAVLAGFVTAISMAAVICRAPLSTSPLLILIILASGYVLVTAISGATGSYVYWIRTRTFSTSDLVQLLQSTASAWVWIPAIVLLSQQDSIWAPAVAGAGAAVLAISLRTAGPGSFHSDVRADEVEPTQQELFAQSLASTRPEWNGSLVAVSLVCVAAAVARGWLFPASALLALAAFAFAWARGAASHASGQYPLPRFSAAALRQTKSAVPALLITTLAMMAGMRHDLQLWGLGNGLGNSANATRKATDLRTGGGGHFSVILLTAPQLQQMLIPHTTQPLPSSIRLTKPMVIQFDGEYWYFQPPDRDPGPTPFKALGNPLTANIHSTLAIPLMMQAHQRLSTPLPVRCCRAIEVELENRDQSAGALDLAVSLSDSAQPNNPLTLGVQPIHSTQGELWRYRSAPAQEIVRFSIPAHFEHAQNQISHFDWIDMLIVPSAQRMQSGAKIAIRTMRLVP
jgi:hypothetical protein